MPIDDGASWLEKELLGDEDLPNTPFSQKEQTFLVNCWRDGDTPEAWAKARKDFQESYGYAPSV